MHMADIFTWHELIVSIVKPKRAACKIKPVGCFVACFQIDLDSVINFMWIGYFELIYKSQKNWSVLENA